MMLGSGALVAYVALHLADIPDLGQQHPLLVTQATMDLADEWLRANPLALIELCEHHGLFTRDDDGRWVAVADRIAALATPREVIL